MCCCSARCRAPTSLRRRTGWSLVDGGAAIGDERRRSIVVENNAELFIPLLTTTIPSAKQFREVPACSGVVERRRRVTTPRQAINSLSAEQQRFASAFRAMQVRMAGVARRAPAEAVVGPRAQLEFTGLPPLPADVELKVSGLLAPAPQHPGVFRAGPHRDRLERLLEDRAAERANPAGLVVVPAQARPAAITTRACA